MSDASAFVAEIDERVSGYLQDIRTRAAAAKADLESGTLSLRAKSQPGGAAVTSEISDWDAGGSLEVPSTNGSLDDLDQFEALAEPTNGSHPLDAPIFGDTDSFLSDDLDFSIDLDDSPPL